MTPRDLAAFYAEGYSVADPREAERLGRWRALGARSKADHAELLLARAGLQPVSVIEIGCGDGALLHELDRRAIAAETLRDVRGAMGIGPPGG